LKKKKWKMKKMIKQKQEERVEGTKAREDEEEEGDPRLSLSTTWRSVKG